MNATMSERSWRWRIGVASAALGAASVVAGLREALGLGWAVGLLLACIAVVGIALRGVRRRVDQATARTDVVYSGEGATAWLMVAMLGVGIVPGLLTGAFADGTVRTLVAGLIAAAVAAASSGVLAATTTPEPQPVPDPVPLGSPAR